MPSLRPPEAVLRLPFVADDAIISAFIVLLHAKGETFQEIAGLARAMVDNCLQVPDLSADAVDIAGLARANVVNISIGTSILAATAGARVAKHGSRSSSSACGSADVLEELGIDFESGPQVPFYVPRHKLQGHK